MKNKELILQLKRASTKASSEISPLFLHLVKTGQQRNASMPLSDRAGVGLVSGLAALRVRRLVMDPDCSHLVNFPFSFGVSFLLLAGALAMGWGMIIPDVTLALLGFVLLLAGSALFGWSLSED